ncbi:MAG: D-glycerate dehydrogenase [Candidatus Cloacimonetes bacterium]|nr:D-glycerate dehydrogenase [Candidatus Cloacimonadota bacterium]
MKPSLFLTRELPATVMKKLNHYFDLTVNPYDRSLHKEEIIEGTCKTDILLCLLTDTIDKDIIRCNPNLKGICNYAVGYNNVDIETASKLKIPVCNTPGVLTETTADLAWALIFAVSRRIVEADKFTREGKFNGWAPQMFLGGDIYGKTLGIVGAGRIGTAVAKRANAFNMKIVYSDATANVELEKKYSAKKMSLNELLEEADFVSLHTPLLPETKHLIGSEQLRLMKSTAYLINTARGQIIDESALVTALKENQIAGAGLDVYENEPDIAEGLTECVNAVLTPHIASASIDTRTKMGFLAYENAVAIAENRIPAAIVNPEIYE